MEETIITIVLFIVLGFIYYCSLKILYPKSENEKAYDSNREKAFEKFKEHIDDDLEVLYNLLHDARNITRQVKFKDCAKKVEAKPQKSGFEDVVKFLADFCGLTAVPIHVVWEPLNATRSLSTIWVK